MRSPNVSPSPPPATPTSAETAVTVNATGFAPSGGSPSTTQSSSPLLPRKRAASAELDDGARMRRNARLPTATASVVATPQALTQAAGTTRSRTDRPNIRLQEPEHQRMVDNFSPGLSSSYASEIRAALKYLEDKGKKYSDLVPPDVARPRALEDVINNAIASGDMRLDARAALNHEYHLAMIGRSGTINTRPSLQEHCDVLDDLPKGLARQKKHGVNEFFRWMERQTPPMQWSQLRPAEGSTRSWALEAAVDQAILDGVPSGARAALNKGFGLTLKSGQGIKEEEHREFFFSLPAATIAKHRTLIKQFLKHLEKQQLPPLSVLREEPTNKRPELLEDAVNQAIHEFGLHPQTRVAFNKAMDLNLEDES